MKIIAFRHGESIGNKKNIVQGHTDFDLTDKGIKQAEKLREKLNIENNDSSIHAYSSDLLRALNTAKIVFPNEDIQTDSRLREQDFGSVVGSMDSFLESNPEYLLKNKDAFKRKFPSGGESIIDVKDRVHDFMSKIVKNHNKDDIIYISCHYTVLISIISIFDNEPIQDIWPKVHFDNCDLVEYEYNPADKLI